MEQIQLEARFFCTSILCGSFLLFFYDIIRIFRQMIGHHEIVVAIEDILFWSFGGGMVFYMIYLENSGEIRGFSFLGLAIGMFCYHKSFSKYFVGTATWIIEKVKRGMRWIEKKLKRPFLWVKAKYDNLKKIRKSSKIKKQDGEHK